MFQRQPCSHMSQINDVEPSAEGCEDCLRTGNTWMHLRECLICGHVGCCDQSVSLQGRNTLWFRATLSRTGSASLSLGAQDMVRAGAVGG